MKHLPYTFLMNTVVVDSETVVAQDGAQLTHDVRLVLPVVQDEHRCEVWSAWHIVGRERKEGVTGSHVHLADTTKGVHL